MEIICLDLVGNKYGQVYCNLPGYPHTILSKNEGEPMDIDNYRSLVGKLLFCIVKVGPDCANADR